jgi:hypothetical protein
MCYSLTPHIFFYLQKRICIMPIRLSLLILLFTSIQLLEFFGLIFYPLLRDKRSLVMIMNLFIGHLSVIPLYRLNVECIQIKNNFSLLGGVSSLL